MLIPDINILVYAYDADSPHHVPAREWWESALSGAATVGLPWIVALGFMRIMTHRRVLRAPMKTADCVKAVRRWLEHPHIQILTPGEQHASILFEFIDKLGTAGDLTTDAHIATLAIEYRAELVSTDADFGRFPGLRWLNPIRRK